MNEVLGIVEKLVEVVAEVDSVDWSKILREVLVDLLHGQSREHHFDVVRKLGN